jgi:hypothetical protein
VIKTDKEQIKKNIEDSVRIFRETLEETYLKEGSDLPFYGIGVHSLMRFFEGKCEKRRTNDGRLRMSGYLPKVIFNEKCKGLPLTSKDYNICPLVITLFHKDFE